MNLRASSQLSPVVSAGHWHVYVVQLRTHVPLFWQGFDSRQTSSPQGSAVW